MMRLARRNLTLALLGCLGCSGGLNRAEVSGKVLVDKQPLERGMINFYPVEGTPGPSAGAEIKNGEYHIARSAGVVVGKNRVEIKGFRKTGRKVPDPMAFGTNTLTDEILQIVPPEYSSQSTLTREIKGGSNTLDFDLPGVKPK
jgi:hypothetical protein